MQNGTKNRSRRPKWLNAYRGFTTFALVAIMVMAAILLYRTTPTETESPGMADKAVAYLEAAGFDDPVYMGITPATEGEYPTFQATAIGGEPVKLFLRTTRSGGWEIQPDGVFEMVTSADEFAELANTAVRDWENMPSGIQPSTDGSYGEYEQRQYKYELLVRYNPDESYWSTVPDETNDWSRTPSK